MQLPVGMGATVCTFAQLTPPCYLNPQFPALSTLRRAKGGDKVAEVLMGHVTRRFLQLQRWLPPSPSGWRNAEEKVR